MVFPLIRARTPHNLINGPTLEYDLGWILMRSERSHWDRPLKYMGPWAPEDLPIVYTHATTHAKAGGARPWFELQVVEGADVFKIMKPHRDSLAAILYATGSTDALTVIETLEVGSFEVFLLYVSMVDDLPVVLERTQTVALTDGAVGKAIARFLALTTADLEGLLMEHLL
jgi:hypothetical protein